MEAAAVILATPQVIKNDVIAGGHPGLMYLSVVDEVTGGRQHAYVFLVIDT